MPDTNSYLDSEVKVIKENYSLTEKENISQRLFEEKQDWNSKIYHKLKNNNPYQEELAKYNYAHDQLKKKCASIIDIESDYFKLISLSKKLDIEADEVFWTEEIEKLKNQSKSKDNEEARLVFRSLLHEKWKKLIDIGYSNWELTILSEYRKSFLKKIAEWLSLLQFFENDIKNSPVGPGLFLDFSQGGTSFSDLEVIHQWAKYISEDKSIKKLFDLLGRIGEAEDKIEEKTASNKKIEQLPDNDMKEEIVGIHLGRDIELALPQELSLLADDNVSILFDLKYVEGRLVCFDKEGWKEEILEEEQVIESKDKEELGPVIICIDTSGSMRGTPEDIAKAVTLFLSSRCIEQKRSCLLVTFSTRIEVLDLTKRTNSRLSKISRFLQKTFSGGTDVSLALSYTLEMMNQDSFKKADVLVISDFIVSELPVSLYIDINLVKSKKNKFFSLSIGDFSLIKNIESVFNEQWVYNSSNGSISKLSQ